MNVIMASNVNEDTGGRKGMDKKKWHVKLTMTKKLMVLKMLLTVRHLLSCNGATGSLLYYIIFGQSA
jgi:hypothetical protein